MFKKRGGIESTSLVKIILVALVILVLIPATAVMLNSTENKRERISCLVNSIVRDKIFDVAKNLIYDLDCNTANYVIRNDRVVYEKFIRNNGEVRKEELVILKYKEEDLEYEVYNFVGEELALGWKSIGGGSLSAEGSDFDYSTKRQCVIISSISFDLEDKNFKFDKDLFLENLKETQIRDLNKRVYISEYLKSATGKSIFRITEGFDNSISDMLYIVYVATDDIDPETKSKYSIFLGRGEDIAKECDAMIV